MFWDTKELEARITHTPLLPRSEKIEFPKIVRTSVRGKMLIRGQMGNYSPGGAERSELHLA